MDRPPTLYRRVAGLAQDPEARRSGLSLLLLVLLWGMDLPWALIVILPILAYSGLRLIGPLTRPVPNDSGRTRTRVDDREAYHTCQRLRAEITCLGQKVPDEENAKRVRAVDDRFGRMLAIIAEDSKYAMSVPLLDLVGTTHDLLSRYVKNIRRQLADEEVHARVRDNLATIDHSCDRLWRQVNRDAVIDLDAMIETIDATLKELDTPMAEPPRSISPPVPPTPPAVPHPPDGDLPDTERPELLDDPTTATPGEAWVDSTIPALDEVEEPPALPIGPINHASRSRSGPEASLTPRELEVLCLIVDGCSNRQIAVNLFISEGTTKRHVTNILAKLDVSSRSAAAAYANRRGLCRDIRPTE